MSSARARVDKAGRLLIPAKLRREMNLSPGDPVILETGEGGLRVRSYRKAIEDAQAIIRRHISDPNRSLVDELIEERRKEAAGE